MRLRIFWLLLSVPLWMFAGRATATEIAPFHAEYEFRVNDMALGATTVVLSAAPDGRWMYTDVTRPTGLLSALHRERRESSTLTFVKGSPRPLEFQGHDSFRSKPREGALHFDWEAGTVSGTWNNVPWSTPLENTFHDPLSYQLAIMSDLARGKQSMDYLITDDAKIKPYHFRVAGQETIQTLMGPFETVRVERAQDSDKRHTTLWCAPALTYLPVQVEQQDGNTRYAMLLRTLTGFDHR